ncbi:hypothetical protein LLG46_01730 [bacterium]|nr:hypothetical protein [bacterium]
MKLFTLIISVCMVVILSAVLYAEEVQPIAINNRAIGGSALNEYTPGVENGAGANNIGLLIKTWGAVTWVDTSNEFFYINDGTGLKDGSMHIENDVESDNIGVRVSYSNLATGSTINPPGKGDIVAVTCISSTVIINDTVQPNLRPRQQSDISYY